MNTEKIKKLKRQIEDLKSRWPAHSVAPGMYMRLEELEEELDKEKNSQQEYTIFCKCSING